MNPISKGIIDAFLAIAFGLTIGILFTFAIAMN